MKRAHLRFWTALQMYSINWTTDPFRTRPDLTRSFSWVANIACWVETASERSNRYRSCVLPISLMSSTCTSGFAFTSPDSIAAIAFGVRFTAMALDLRSKREREENPTRSDSRSAGDTETLEMEMRGREMAGYWKRKITDGGGRDLISKELGKFKNKRNEVRCLALSSFIS